MDKSISFTANGKQRSVTSDPERALLDVLREDLQLTGAKYGCGERECGACSVLVDGKRVFSCRTPVSKVEGKTVVTVEGLADGEKLHPVQEAFLAEGAFQCGYCTAGMIVAAVGMLAENPKPTDAQINDALKDSAGKPQALGLVDGNAGQVLNQGIGVAIAWVAAIVGTLVILKVVDATIGLRVTAEQEIEGLDTSLHNEEGYNLET